MKQYLDIVNNVLNNGKWKGNRTGVRTLTTFCEIFRHNMADGFPLLTTKKMPLRIIAVELEGFINGVTDKRWFQERGCHIWDEWSNPKGISLGEVPVENWPSPMMINWNAPNTIEEEQRCGYSRKEWIKKERLRSQRECNDLGPIYGFQWRNFNGYYSVDNGFSKAGELGSTDQLKNAIDTLKKDPNDRRMVISAWNPNQMQYMALPPCHYAFTLVHIDGVLNLCWKQRSCDLMLGVPFNIASYALLLELICKETNLIPGELVGILEDCHIYENHINGAKEQLTRTPKELPKIKLPNKPFFEWTHEDIILEEYNPHPKINFGGVAI